MFFSYRQRPVNANVMREKPHGHKALEVYEGAVGRYQEMDYVANHLLQMHQTGVPWNNMAVFYRRNEEVRSLPENKSLLHTV
jgi:superfamily I DNA/RNA helicase